MHTSLTATLDPTTRSNHPCHQNRQQQGFPAEGMFSGAQGHPTYDSSAGQPDDDVPEQREGESGAELGAEEGGQAAPGAGNNNNNHNDRSYLTQQPAEDEWSSGSDLEPLSGAVNVGQPASSSSAAAAATAAALAAEEEAEVKERVGEEGQSGMIDREDVGAPPPSSNGMGWDSVAAAAGGGVSEEDGSRFSHPGESVAGGVVAGGADLMSFRDDEDRGRVGGGSGGDGSPLTAASDIMRHVSTVKHVRGVMVCCWKQVLRAASSFPGVLSTALPTRGIRRALL